MAHFGFGLNPSFLSSPVTEKRTIPVPSGGPRPITDPSLAAPLFQFSLLLPPSCLLPPTSRLLPSLVLPTSPFVLPTCPGHRADAAGVSRGPGLDSEVTARYLAVTSEVTARYLAVTSESAPGPRESPAASAMYPAAAGSIETATSEVTARYLAVTLEVTARYLAVTFENGTAAYLLPR